MSKFITLDTLKTALTKFKANLSPSLAKLDSITGVVTADKLQNPDHPTDLVAYEAFQAAVPLVQSMNLTGAQVGQTIKVKAVNEQGMPTAWEAADMPSGGGGNGGAKEFRLIQSITLGEQSDRVDISLDSSGNAFALHEVYVMLSAQSYEDANNEVTFVPNGRWGAGDPYIVSGNKASKSSETWKNNMVFHSVYADGVICSEQLPAKAENTKLSSSFAINQEIITKISMVCKFAAGCTFLVIGR